MCYNDIKTIECLRGATMATTDEQKKRIAYNKIKNGSEPITYSDCMLAVQYKSNIIVSIPNEYKTDEMYKRLFDVTPRILL